MGRLRAAIEGCEVVVQFEDGDDLSPDLRGALAALAEAMGEQQLGSAEVEGFGLRIGDLGRLKGAELSTGKGWSCWGYWDDGCTWMSGGGDCDLSSCTVMSE